MVHAVRFEAVCHTVWGEQVAVCGSCASLGNWDVARAVLLEVSEYPLWRGEVDVGDGRIEFKYVVVRADSDGRLFLVRWEEVGQNRSLEADSQKLLVLRDEFGRPDNSNRRFEEEPKKAVDAGEGKGSAKGGYANESSPSKSQLMPPEASGTTSRGRKMSPVPSEGKKIDRLGSGLLAGLEVEPSVGLRLVRSKSCKSFEEKYEVLSGSILGTGMSGGVCVAQVRTNGSEVALKTLDTKCLTEQQHKQTLAEVQNQLTMDHQNICRLFEVYEEPTCLRLVMERLRGPDLYEHWSSRGTYTEGDAAGCVRQICSAVAYCHSRGVCHRDLKLENFCFEDKAEDARLKMIDFGLSAFMSTPMTDAVGTLYYVAPEVMKGHYDEKCDMWSLGVVTYVMLNGGPPFRGRDDRETLQLIRRGCYHLPEKRLSEHACDFIRSLLRLDPEKRLDAKGALAHAWLGEATQEATTPIPLDPGVLKGIRSFVRSNALKRAVMSAVAPVASAEEVRRWADQFETLDPEGTGAVSVQALAEQLRKTLSLSTAEAASISSALALNGASGDSSDEQVSYSGFLAACLSAHTKSVEDSQLRELFSRLDTDGDGKVTLEQIGEAMADTVDLEELRADLSSAGGEISFEEFRWLVLRPTNGLQSVLRTCNAVSGGGLERDWRVDTKLARTAGTGDTEAIEAARRENATWRLWWLQQGGTPNPSPTVSRSGSRQTSPRSVTRTNTNAEKMQSVPSDVSTRTRDQFEESDLPKADEALDFRQHWSLKTSAAKTSAPGTEEAEKAAREENMAWRKWNMEKIEKESAGSQASSPSPQAS